MLVGKSGCTRPIDADPIAGDNVRRRVSAADGNPGPAAAANDVSLGAVINSVGIGADAIVFDVVTDDDSLILISQGGGSRAIKADEVSGDDIVV